MRVSRRWLADFVDLPVDDADELAGVFSSLGHEVESVEHLEPEFRGVVSAVVEDVAPHPNADKVRVCQVTTGEDTVEVVCGAWNFEAGATVAFARPGAVLAGGFELGVREIRGVTSNGMICSERELGLGEDHAGILVLDAGVPVGVELGEIVGLPDVVFDLAITPNRPDCMSMVGIARELSAYYRIPFRVPPADVATVPEETGLTVSILDPSGCYRFVGREVRGVSVRPSPLWMRQRLRAAGQRPISNVVDVTNYVMLELGQPLHAFDLDTVAEERIIVRRARAGERLTTLDGAERVLVADDLVVADPRGASSLAGTMGGEHSEVSPATSRILVEAAAWDPPTIMYMSKRLGLRSEASARFERGVDPNLAPAAAARATRLIVETGGGEALGGVQDEVAVAHEPWTVELTVDDVTRVLGSGFEAADIVGLLERLHLSVEEGEPMRVTVPTFRRDLTRPIDLVEEVARLHGYEQFGETIPFGRGGGWSMAQQRRRHLGEVLTGMGLSEVVPLSFMRPEDLDALGVPADDDRRLTIRVKNPLRDEESMLRSTLLPGLLRVAGYNLAHGVGAVAVFEMGKVYLDRPHPTLPRIPDQPDRLGLVLVGSFGPRSLDGTARAADVFTGAGLWRVVARRLGLDAARLEPAEVPGFHPGRTAHLLVGERLVGVLGELHPAAARSFELPGRVVAAELDLEPLLEPPALWQFVEPSVFPPVTFDLAFEVGEGVTAADLVEVTTEAGGPFLETVRVFDEFRGGAVQEGRKSLALTYTFRSPERTLTNEDAVPLRRAMVQAARERLGATLRGEA